MGLRHAGVQEGEQHHDTGDDVVDSVVVFAQLLQKDSRYDQRNDHSDGCSQIEREGVLEDSPLIFLFVDRHSIKTSLLSQKDAIQKIFDNVRTENRLHEFPKATFSASFPKSDGRYGPYVFRRARAGYIRPIRQR